MFFLLPVFFEITRNSGVRAASHCVLRLMTVSVSVDLRVCRRSNKKLFEDLPCCLPYVQKSWPSLSKLRKKKEKGTARSFHSNVLPLLSHSFYCAQFLQANHRVKESTILNWQDFSLAMRSRKDNLQLYLACNCARKLLLPATTSYIVRLASIYNTCQKPTLTSTGIVALSSFYGTSVWTRGHRQGLVTCLYKPGGLVT